MINQLFAGVGFLLSETGGDGIHPAIFVVVGVLIVGMLVYPIISRRRRGRQINDMRSTIRIGDEIMTIGGIVGTVVEVIERSPVDKDFVIETGSGSNRSTMLFDLRALHENRTRIKELREDAAKAAEIARINKENKKNGVSAQSAADNGEWRNSSENETPFDDRFAQTDTTADNPDN